MRSSEPSWRESLSTSGLPTSAAGSGPPRAIGDLAAEDADLVEGLARVELIEVVLRAVDGEVTLELDRIRHAPPAQPIFRSDAILTMLAASIAIFDPVSVTGPPFRLMRAAAAR